MSDLIKRSDAIEAVADYFDYSRRFVEGILNEVPSADRPQGEWIKTDRFNCGARVYQCSVCGEDIDEMPTVMGVPKYKFCPYCRARMKGADDDR